MKINGVSLNSVAYANMPNLSVQKNKVADVQNNVVRNQTNPLKSYPLGYVPYQINFEGGEYAKLPEIMKLKTLKNLPCPYCGTKMMPSNIFGSLLFDNCKVPRTLATFVSASLGAFSKLSSTEKKTLSGLKEQSEKTPDVLAYEVIDSLENKDELSNEFVMRAYRPMNTREYTDKAIDTISSVEDCLLPVQAEVFSKIKEFRKANPKKSLQDALAFYRPEALSNLKSTQFDIFNQIQNRANEVFITSGDKKRLASFLNKSKSIIMKDFPGQPFTRKEFLKELGNLEMVSNEDRKKLAELKRIGSQLPTSESSADAFIAKYSNLKSYSPHRTNQCERSNQEIAQKLIDGSLYSVEHIKPQKTFKLGHDKYDHSKDNVSNLILTHRKCNTDRDCLTLLQYMNVNPHVQKNIQKHVDALANEIKSGSLEGMENYPYGIAKSYIEGTNGKIEIDMSKVDEAVKFVEDSKKATTSSLN